MLKQHIYQDDDFCIHCGNSQDECYFEGLGKIYNSTCDNCCFVLELEQQERDDD
jgi:hypothetical protein